MKLLLSISFSFFILVSCDSPDQPDQQYQHDSQSLQNSQNSESEAPTKIPEEISSTESSQKDFNLTEIADGIYVHQGVHVEIEHEDHADMPNIGFIIGDDCVAVIDTGGSIASGEKLRAAIKEKTDTPICYVINSHVHFDHVLGNAAFKQDNPEYVGHVNLADAMEQNREFFKENFGVDDIVGPDLSVEESMEIDLGNRVLLLTANPKAHTTTDLSILDTKTNTLWLADLLFMERAPALDGSIKSWHALMEGLHEHDYAQVIPGHGPARAGWPEAMEPQQQYFREVIEETRSAIEEGVSLGDAVKTVGQPESKNWLLFEAVHQRNVNRVYRELEWE